MRCIDTNGAYSERELKVRVNAPTKLNTDVLAAQLSSLNDERNSGGVIALGAMYVISTVYNNNYLYTFWAFWAVWYLEWGFQRMDTTWGGRWARANTPQLLWIQLNFKSYEALIVFSVLVYMIINNQKYSRPKVTLMFGFWLKFQPTRFKILWLLFKLLVTDLNFEWLKIRPVISTSTFSP